MDRVLVYIPGMEGTGRLFFRQKPVLENSFRCVTVRLRNSIPFSYSDLVEDVVTVLNREGADRVVMVAESFGGSVALQFALQHQKRIEHLVLVNTFPYFRRRLSLQLGLLLLPFGFVKPGRWVREKTVTKVLCSESLEQDAIDQLLECSFSDGYAVTRQRMNLIKQIDVRNRLREIQCPVTVIASAKDKLVPSIKEARLMTQKMPNARMIVLPDEGHTCLLSSHFSLLPFLDVHNCSGELDIIIGKSSPGGAL